MCIPILRRSGTSITWENISRLRARIFHSHRFNALPCSSKQEVLPAAEHSQQNMRKVCLSVLTVLKPMRMLWPIFVVSQKKTAAAVMPSRLSQWRSEEHTSELQSRGHLVCRLLLEKKKRTIS